MVKLGYLFHTARPPSRHEHAGRCWAVKGPTHQLMDMLLGWLRAAD